jgi:MYXO-CTERM domain-containing protein
VVIDAPAPPPDARSTIDAIPPPLDAKPAVPDAKPTAPDAKSALTPEGTVEGGGLSCSVTGHGDAPAGAAWLLLVGFGVVRVNRRRRRQSTGLPNASR